MNTQEKKVDYLKKMDEIISEKQKRGLVGMNFCVLPEGSESGDDYQGMARAFCMVEELRNQKFLKATSSNAL